MRAETCAAARGIARQQGHPRDQSMRADEEIRRRVFARAASLAIARNCLAGEQKCAPGDFEQFRGGLLHYAIQDFHGAGSEREFRIDSPR